MRILKSVLLALGAFYHALVLEGHRCGLTVHCVTEIGLIAEDIGYGRGFPIIRRIGIGDRAVFACFGMAIHGWLEYLLIPKNITDILRADARGAEGEYLFYNGCSFGIDDQVVLL